MSAIKRAPAGKRSGKGKPAKRKAKLMMDESTVEKAMARLVSVFTVERGRVQDELVRLESLAHSCTHSMFAHMYTILKESAKYSNSSRSQEQLSALAELAPHIIGTGEARTWKEGVEDEPYKPVNLSMLMIHIKEAYDMATALVQAAIAGGKRQDECTCEDHTQPRTGLSYTELRTSGCHAHGEHYEQLHCALSGYLTAKPFAYGEWWLERADGMLTFMGGEYSGRPYSKWAHVAYRAAGITSHNIQFQAAVTALHAYYDFCVDIAYSIRTMAGCNGW